VAGVGVAGVGVAGGEIGVVAVEVVARLVADVQTYFLAARSLLVQDLALLMLRAADYFPSSCHHVLLSQHVQYWVPLQDPVLVGYLRLMNDYVH